MTTISIANLEAALNYYTGRYPSEDKVSICKPARILADCYGVMVYKRQMEIPVSELSQAQREVYEDAAKVLSLTN